MRNIVEVGVGVSVVSHLVAFRIFTFQQFGPLASGDADNKKCSGHIFCFKHIQNFGSPTSVGTIVKGDGQFLFGRAELIDVIGKRIGFELFPSEEIGGGVVGKTAATVFRNIDEVPNVTIAFENQVWPRRNIGDLVANGIAGARRPDWPHGSICGAQPPQCGALNAHAVIGTQLVVGGQGIKHPHLVDVVVVVIVGVMWIQRDWIELHGSFGFGGANQGFLNRQGFRSFLLFLRRK